MQCLCIITRLFCSEQEFSKHADELRESAHGESLITHMEAICDTCSNALFKTHRRLFVRADLTQEINELKNKQKVIAVNEKVLEAEKEEEVEQYMNISYDIYKESVYD